MKESTKDKNQLIQEILHQLALVIHENPNCKMIPLTQGLFTLVDKDQYEYLNQFKWYAKWCNNTFYVCRNTPKNNSKNRTTLSMHRQVMGFPKGLEIDHIDNNGLNNIKTNLREATRKENSHNSISRKNHTTDFKGVCWKQTNKKYQAQSVDLNGKKKYLGLYDNPVIAALAVDDYNLKIFGKFAKLNIDKNGEYYKLFKALYKLDLMIKESN
jgi:hypothetical protein